MSSPIEFGKQVLALHALGDWESCHSLLDGAAASADPEERAQSASWRALTLRKEGRHTEALDFLVSHRNDFFCKCGADLARADILTALGRPDEALNVMAAAPIEAEIDTFPALAGELAYRYCLTLAKRGRPTPDRILALIPDDFETFDGGYNRPVDKDYLLAFVERARKGSPPR